MALLSPLSLEYEGPALWAALELARGHNIYDPQRLAQAPWAVTIYTPLYFILGAPFQLGGFNYPGLRLISMVADIASLFFFYKLASLYSRDKLNVAIGMVLFASYVAVWSGSLKARVDMFALAFSIAALYYVVKRVGAGAVPDLAESVASSTEKKERSKFAIAFERMAPAFALTVAAIYAKLSSIMILPAVFLFLLLRKRYYELAAYTTGSIVASGLVLILLNFITDGGFLPHITFPFNVPFSTSELKKHLELLGVDWPKLVIVPVIAVVWFFKTKERSRLLLPLILAIISGVLTVYTIGTMHANLNHGLIFYFSLSWLTILFLESYPLSFGTGMVLASALCAYILSTQIPIMFNLSNRMGRSVEDLKQLQMQHKTMFVEDPAHAIICGAEPLFVDVATFLQVWDRDKRSLEDIEQGLSEKRYSAVVINLNDSLNDKPAQFWSEGVLQKIRDNYKKVDYVVGNGELQQLYIPK